MEDVRQIIIPTLSRTKISRNLSFPIGAEHISLALASTAQLSEIKLHFYSSKFNIGLRSGQYEFLRVEYLNNARPRRTSGPLPTSTAVHRSANGRSSCSPFRELPAIGSRSTSSIRRSHTLRTGSRNVLT